jgi:Uma2 family endonuclease
MEQMSADMVVEIVSPESSSRDRGDKFVEYEAAGIREYWLIDPTRKQAEFYVLDENGHYQTVSTGAEGVFHSQVVPGFSLKVEWLWQRPLPRVLPILKEMGIS